MSCIRRLLALAILVGPVCVATLHAQLTVPERTRGERTSTHAEVLAFIDSLVHRGARMEVGTLGESPHGRRLPYVILSRPLVTTPAAARRTGKPVLYIEANIHAGEVEGKEAVQMLMRDLTLGTLRPLLDSVIMLFVPIYNADGNDALGPQDINRGEQVGPELVGLRANGQGYDLNRDYVKQEAPETRASLAFVTKWDPDLFMDLHTTDGSYHGYALTWSPGLNPNRTPTNEWVQDTVLEQVRRRLRQRDHVETYLYGNFDGGNAAPTGWRTYESLARYGTNLAGMTRVSILSEAMSHDPFLRRIESTYDFVLETIRYLNEHRTEMRQHEALTARTRPDSVVVRGNSLAVSPVRVDS
ncbi:MAG: M14 family metallopeptidase, partial [Gemmatimonadales bacterium]